MLSDAVLYGVRTFLDPDNAEPQLPDQPEVNASYTLERGESTLAAITMRRISSPNGVRWMDWPNFVKKSFDTGFLIK